MVARVSVTLVATWLSIAGILFEVLTSILRSMERSLTLFEARNHGIAPAGLQLHLRLYALSTSLSATSGACGIYLVGTI